MNEPVERRPILTVEIQPRPPISETCSPYFWGAGMLNFRDESGVIVWEAEVPWGDKGYTRARKRDGFGWVVVTTFFPPNTDETFERLGLPRYIEGGPRA